ncbi:MAG: hypothetical protein JSV56_02250 [Methanomassiliicoccales archaeon]|nr:MAG: hypothetical protein JSV56_02250 [Methanomassiliicoccales archaeon]
MAEDETQDISRSYKDLKKMAKQQKKSQKKAKKRGKIEKKIAKKEAKMRKKGVFLDDITPTEEAPEEEAPPDFEATPWVRKSTENVPYLEKKIDRMGDRRKDSSLHAMFEERYGESLMVPETYLEYELTDSEKRRLEAMEVETVGTEEEVTAATEEEAVVAVETEETSAAEEKVESKKAAKAKAKVTELKPFYYPFQLWLYTKFGKDKFIVLKILILLISIVGFIFLLIPRIVIFVLITIFKKIKQRSASKATSEA